jgi:hypothetical protein
MLMVFQCACGKKLQADDALAGRMTRCPRCQSVIQIPRPAIESEPSEEMIPSSAPQPEAGPGGPAPYDLEPPPAPAMTPPEAPILQSSPGGDLSPSGGHPGSGSIREYAYVLLALALIPLFFSLLGKEESRTAIVDRIEATLQRATEEQRRRAMPVLSKQEVGLDELLRVMPEGKLLGAHLPRDSGMHWIYAAVAAA